MQELQKPAGLFVLSTHPECFVCIEQKLNLHSRTAGQQMEGASRIGISAVYPSPAALASIFSPPSAA